MTNPSGKAEVGDREGASRDWVGGLTRAVLAIYLLPALLAALAVGGLALVIGAGVRAARAIGRQRPLPSRSNGLDPRHVRHGLHLSMVSRQPPRIGWSGREIQPRS